MLPATNGFSTARHARMFAPFHGVKLATTPRGLRTPTEWVPAKFDASTSPLGRYTQFAACSSAEATKSCWNAENGIVLPVSRARIPATSGARRRTISAALKNSRAFSAGGVSAHGPKASCAAEIASRASSAPQSGTRAYRLPVYGSKSSNNLPPETSRHWPPAYHWYSLMSATVVDIKPPRRDLVWPPACRVVTTADPTTCTCRPRSTRRRPLPHQGVGTSHTRTTISIGQ